MNTRKVQDYVKILKRRERFLENRINDREDEEKTHYDRAELSATNWTIRYIEDTILTAAEHQSGQFKEKFNG
jgi:hypothetical protein